MRVRIETRIFPTEDEEKIIKGLQKIFPGIDFKKEGEKVVGGGEKIEIFRFLKQSIRQRDIAPTIEDLLKRGTFEDCVVFKLNKQAACAGKVNFIEEEPILGPINVEVRTPAPLDFIKWLLSSESPS
jgi:hypothetical protein